MLPLVKITSAGPLLTWAATRPDDTKTSVKTQNNEADFIAFRAATSTPPLRALPAIEIGRSRARLVRECARHPRGRRGPPRARPDLIVDQCRRLARLRPAAGSCRWRP